MKKSFNSPNNIKSASNILAHYDACDINYNINVLPAQQLRESQKNNSLLGSSDIFISSNELRNSSISQVSISKNLKENQKQVNRKNDQFASKHGHSEKHSKFSSVTIKSVNEDVQKLRLIRQKNEKNIQPSQSNLNKFSTNYFEGISTESSRIYQATSPSHKFILSPPGPSKHYLDQIVIDDLQLEGEQWSRQQNRDEVEEISFNIQSNKRKANPRGGNLLMVETKQSQVLQRCTSIGGNVKIVENKRQETPSILSQGNGADKTCRMKLKDYLHMAQSSSRLNGQTRKERRRAVTPSVIQQANKPKIIQISKQQKYRIDNRQMFNVLKDEIFSDLSKMEQRLGRVKTFLNEMSQNNVQLNEKQLLILYNLRGDIKQKITDRVTDSLQVICQERKLNEMRMSIIEHSNKFQAFDIKGQQNQQDFFKIAI